MSSLRFVQFAILQLVVICRSVVPAAADLTFDHLPPECGEREIAGSLLSNGDAFGIAKLPYQLDTRIDYTTIAITGSYLASLAFNDAEEAFKVKSRYFRGSIPLNERLTLRMGGLPEMLNAKANCLTGLFQCLLPSCSSDPDGFGCIEIDITQANIHELKGFDHSVRQLSRGVRVIAVQLLIRYPNGAPQGIVKTLKYMKKNLRQYKEAVTRYGKTLPARAGYSIHCDPTFSPGAVL